MKARITSAGHVWLHHKSGMLRVRVDFFPDPGDPLYDGCRVQVPERPFNAEELAQVDEVFDDESKTDAEKSAWLEQFMAACAIPKVWRTNPINCHMFLMPLGFTQADLDQAIEVRMAELKAKMATDQADGYSQLHGMPPQLCVATRPPKGDGLALIPTAEKEWTQQLAEQAGAILDGKEITDRTIILEG